jgi:putative phosphoesterase
VDRIVHAGDVGRAEILTELAAIAPLTAIRGNVDHGDWADALPETAQLSVGQVTLHMLHDVLTLAIDPIVARVDVVIFGHSHQPQVERRGRVLYLNPGSAGPRRFTLPTSIAILTIDARHVDAKIVTLMVAGG